MKNTFEYGQQQEMLTPSHVFGGQAFISFQGQWHTHPAADQGAE